ncbi:MAG: hypothetical protein JW987_01435 [Anaerolineaceae bacterium]|nr:hypothetical protein [Anaerolineaceae bacterium]
MKINFMRISPFVLLAAMLVLSACNLPTTSEPSPTADLVGTEVSRLLTEQPVEQLPGPGDTPVPIPSSTTAPDNTPEPTLPPTPEPSFTPTTNPGDPRQVYGEPSWNDSLSSDNNFWKDENDHTKIASGDGVLLLTGKTTDGWHGWSLTYAQSPTNFYLEGNFRTQTCAGNDLYGLVFRAGKESSGYFYGFTCDGEYRVRAIDFNNDLNSELVELKSSPSILSGSNQANRIGVLAQGNKFTLYANGVLLEEITDGTFTSGYIGAFVAANSTPNFTVELDEISLWNLP